MPAHYEIRLRDHPGAQLTDSFEDLEVCTDGCVLLLRGELDQSALHGLLERARLLQVVLLDVRRSRSSPRREPWHRSPRRVAGCGPATMLSGGDPVTRSPYEIRVVGALGPAAREAFADLAIDVEPTATVLSATLDQPSLHAVLDRVRALGLELLDVKQAPDPPPGPADGPPG